MSSTGKMGKLGSDEAGATVSHSGGADVVDDMRGGVAAAEVIEMTAEEVCVVELSGKEVALWFSTTGEALSRVAQ